MFIAVGLELCTNDLVFSDPFIDHKKRRVQREHYRKNNNKKFNVHPGHLDEKAGGVWDFTKGIEDGPGTPAIFTLGLSKCGLCVRPVVHAGDNRIVLVGGNGYSLPGERDSIVLTVRVVAIQRN